MAQETKPQSRAGAAAPVRAQGKTCILIVEDEQIVARDIQIGLRKAGYDVPPPASTFEEGLALAERLRPDIVLLDIGLSSEKDGIALGREIYTRLDIPVVFATAYSDPATIQRAKDAAPSGYILKPYDVREVRTVVEIAIYKHRLSQSLRMSEERYRMLFQRSPVGIVHFGADLAITDANERFAALVGSPLEAIVNLPVTRIFDPSVHGVLLGTLRGEAGRFAGQMRRPSDKAVVRVSVRTSPFHDARGRTIGGVAIIEDVTDQHIMEESLVRRITLENIVTGSAARLINAPDARLQNELQHTLDAVGTFLAADRCFVDLFDMQNTCVEATHEWAAPGVTVRGQNHKGTSLSRWPWALAKLHQGERVCLHSVVDLPPEADEDARFWHDEGVRSLLLFPLSAATRLFGLFAVVVEQEERIWAGEDLRLLQLLGEVLAGVLARQISVGALYKSEERYRRITSEITDYMYTVRLERGHWRETIHGPGCLNVTGYAQQEYERDPHLWLRMVDDRDRPQVLDQVRRVLAGEPVPPLEHRIVRKDGVVRWVKNTPVLHFAADGTLLSYDGLMQDITERHEVEDDLRMSEERFRVLVENLNDAVFGLDGRGYFTYISPRVIAMTGFTPDEVVGEHFIRFVHPHDRQTVLEGWERTLAGQIGDYESRILTRDGEERFVRVSARVRPDRDGSVVVAGIMHDTTEERRTRARIQAWEARFYETMDRLRLPVVELDAQGSMLYWNEAAASLCRRAHGSLHHHRWIDVCVAPEDRARANGYMRDILLGEAIPAPVTFAVLDPQGGAALPVRWTVRALAGEGDVPVGVAFTGETPVHPEGRIS
jgi:PAS domain S-box-containing protein